MIKGTKNVSLADIYEVIEPYALKTSNNHWKAKVRQTVQDTRYFNRRETGIYHSQANLQPASAGFIFAKKTEGF